MAESHLTEASRVWKRFLALIPLALVLVLASRTYVRLVGTTFVGDLYTNADVDINGLVVKDPSVVEIVSAERVNDYAWHVTLRAVSDGDTRVVHQNGEDVDEAFDVHVGDGVIIVDGIYFSGWESILWSVVVFLVVTCALCVSAIRWLYERVWFGYKMVACGGVCLFCACQLLMFVWMYTSGNITSFLDLAFDISDMAPYFLMYSIAPMGIAAVLVAVSNVSLIRHEGLRPVNLLGIAAGVTWLLSMLVWMGVFLHGGLYSGIKSYLVVHILDSCMAVAIVLGECLLASTVLCGWQAARHKPRREADFLVVLGCGLRADGTPTPLLQGRVDRALAFANAQVARGGVPVTFVPSGGQGPDEACSEAQSMSRYLQSRGVPTERILLEDRSERTSENMAFSRAVIERATGADAGDYCVSFATTNYHVFRGYVCANQAGMDVEGLSSPTRAYFWPNAFLREFVGLLANQWRTLVVTYVGIVVLYVLIQYVVLPV